MAAPVAAMAAPVAGNIVDLWPVAAIATHLCPYEAQYICGKFPYNMDKSLTPSLYYGLKSCVKLPDGSTDFFTCTVTGEEMFIDKQVACEECPRWLKMTEVA